MTANELNNFVIFLLQGAGAKERTFNNREMSIILSLAQLEVAKRRIDGLKNRTGRGFDESKMRQMELAGLVSASATFRRDNHDFMIGTDSNGAFETPDLDAQADSTQQFGVFCRIPNEVLHITSESCNIVKDIYTARNVPVERINATLYNEWIYNSFKGPGYDSVWAIPFGSFTTANTTDPNAIGSGAKLENSTKYGDARVDETTIDTKISGFRGLSTKDNSTEVWIQTEQSIHLIPAKDYTIDAYRLHYIKAPSPIVVNLYTPALQRNPELSSNLHEEIAKVAVQIATGAIIPMEAKYQIADKEVRENE